MTKQPPESEDAIVWRDQPVAPPIRRLNEGGLRELPWLADLSLLLDRKAPLILRSDACRETIASHLGDVLVEQGGLLIGSAWSLTPEEPDAPLAVLCVEEAVPALDAVGSGTSLRMDTELWGRAQALAAARGDIIVGWYHSHPDLGAFFSFTDRRTQAAVFRHPYSLGLVIDPIRGEERWFLGRRCREVGPACQFPGRHASLDQDQDGGADHEDR
ncbi:MAG: Mov34/MPN/PAD-1 family protein [Alphaproteobacteria bacterium]|nr:Mov34/MPN/PAD-1 family protein [Alphaproteobacteria bacterium]MBV8406871.1 Mov34/MPN/PAD-1 family protein [Alphaproteobacteria bacterium]